MRPTAVPKKGSRRCVRASLDGRGLPPLRPSQARCPGFRYLLICYPSQRVLSHVGPPCVDYQAAKLSIEPGTGPSARRGLLVGLDQNWVRACPGATRILRPSER